MKKSVLLASVVGLITMGSSAASLAALPDALQSLVVAAINQPTNEAVAQAIRPVFTANTSLAVDIATEGARQAPASCGVMMREGSAAAPDLAVDIAASIIAVVPACEPQVAQILTDVLEAAAGPEDLEPAAGGAPGPGAPNPIGPVSTTGENPATVVTTAADTTPPAPGTAVSPTIP